MPRPPLLLALGILLLARVAAADTHLLNRIAIVQPTGWDSPIVPRVSAGSAPGGQLTTAPTLSPTDPVWLNWAVSTNAAIMGPWLDQLELDGLPVQVLPRRKVEFVARDWFAMDAGPFYLRGGRHTLEARADVGDRFEDYNFRYDNVAYRQLLWTPEPLPATPGVYFSFDGPPVPVPAAGPLANNHAYSFAPPLEPWAVAVQSAEDVDLSLFDDFTSSTTGLSHAVAASSRTLDSLDVVISAGGGLPAPAALYPAVTRKPGAADASYFVDWNSGGGRLDTDGDAFWGAESLDAHRFVNLYQVDLQAGGHYPMSVWTRVGPVPVHFAVFSPSPSFVGSLDQAIVRSQVVPGQDYEVASFTPAASGRYLILAYRERSADVQERYQLAVGSQAVSVEDGAGDTPWLSASPNPSQTEARIAFTLASAARLKLDILDLQGRLVRNLLDGPREAGPNVATWDLRNAAGGRVSPGLYWVRLDLGASRRLARLSIVR